MAELLNECPTCADRGEEIRRAMLHVKHVEVELARLRHKTRHQLEEVRELRELRPRIAELEFEVAVLRLHAESTQ